MKYRLTGKYYTAPDRGDPEGSWNPFQHSFEAESDGAANLIVKAHLEVKYPGCELGKDFKDLNLIRYEEVQITSI